MPKGRGLKWKDESLINAVNLLAPFKLCQCKMVMGDGIIFTLIQKVIYIHHISTQEIQKCTEVSTGQLKSFRFKKCFERDLLAVKYNDQNVGVYIIITTAEKKLREGKI